MITQPAASYIFYSKQIVSGQRGGGISFNKDFSIKDLLDYLEKMWETACVITLLLSPNPEESICVTRSQLAQA